MVDDDDYHFFSSAGYVAHSMGLPIKMVAAVTPNDIVHRTLQVISASDNLWTLDNFEDFDTSSMVTDDNIVESKS